MTRGPLANQEPSEEQNCETLAMPVASQDHSASLLKGGKDPTTAREGGKDPTTAHEGGRTPPPLVKGGKDPTTAREGGKEPHHHHHDGSFVKLL